MGGQTSGGQTAGLGEPVTVLTSGGQSHCWHGLMVQYTPIMSEDQARPMVLPGQLMARLSFPLHPFLVPGVIRSVSLPAGNDKVAPSRRARCGLSSCTVHHSMGLDKPSLDATKAEIVI